MNVLREEKKRLRREYRARRSWHVSTCNTLDDAIALSTHAFTWEVFSNLSHTLPIAGYWPVNDEMDPRPLLYALEEKGHILCLPSIMGDQLIFRRWTSHTPLIPGCFGINEPSSHAERIKPQIVLVPLIGFNRDGARIGQGRGYYDRALAHLRQHGNVQTLGIAYGCQEILDSLPQESHDMRLQAVATEKELIVCLDPS